MATPVSASHRAGIKVEGNNKWLTVIRRTRSTNREFVKNLLGESDIFGRPSQFKLYAHKLLLEQFIGALCGLDVIGQGVADDSEFSFRNSLRLG